MYAAHIIEKHKWKVILITLKDFNYDLDFEDSIYEYFKTSFDFNFNPLMETDRLLLLVDGLDELSAQGSEMFQTAKKFLIAIINFGTRNETSNRFKMIITGRDLVVEENRGLINSKHIINLVPYCLLHINPVEVAEVSGFDDPNKVIHIDQRQEWWKKYGNLKNKPLQRSSY